MNEASKPSANPRCHRATRWFLLAGWLLMMPPVPMGTSLPPLSEWTRLKSYDTSQDCERAKDAMREAARHTVAANPNANALEVAAALGQLQAKCVEDQSGEAPAKP